MVVPLRLAHISDLHFLKWDWSMLDFFSKRFLGNLNFLLGRKREFDHQRLNSLPSLFTEKGITHLLVTGDLTVTTSRAELKMARAFIQRFQDRGIEVLCVPGNHDQYTRRAYRKGLFYNYFSRQWDVEIAYDLKENGITAKKISPQWWVVGLDTTLATPWYASFGQFFRKVEENLIVFLNTLQKDHRVILMNHFPFFQNEGFRKRLKDGERLKDLLHEIPLIKIFCHGHTHRRCLANLQSSNLPILLDSGSTPHRDYGGWNLLHLSEQELKTQIYHWEEDHWSIFREEVHFLTIT